MLIRETYQGDAYLTGGPVDVGHDYFAWSGNLGSVPTGPYGQAAGDYANYAFNNPGQAIDVGHDYFAWSGNLGASTGAIASPLASGVSAVPEPSSLLLLGVAVLVGLVYVGKWSSPWIVGLLISTSLRLKGIGGMRKCALGLLAGFVSLAFAQVRRPNWSTLCVRSRATPTTVMPMVTALVCKVITRLPGTALRRRLACKSTTSIRLVTLPHNYVSFELYAAIQGGTKPFYNQAFNGSNITVQQSGTAQLTPDLADLAWLVVFIQLISTRAQHSGCDCIGKQYWPACRKRRNGHQQ